MITARPQGGINDLPGEDLVFEPADPICSLSMNRLLKNIV